MDRSWISQNLGNFLHSLLIYSFLAIILFPHKATQTVPVICLPSVGRKTRKKTPQNQIDIVIDCKEKLTGEV